MCLDAFETVSLVNLRALLDDVTDLFLVSDAQCIISQFLQRQKMRFIVFKFVQLYCIVPVYLQWQKRSKHSSWQWQTGRWKLVGSVCLAHLPPCVQPSFGYMTPNDFWSVVFRGKYTLSFSWLVATGSRWTRLTSRLYSEWNKPSEQNKATGCFVLPASKEKNWHELS